MELYEALCLGCSYEALPCLWSLGPCTALAMVCFFPSILFNLLPLVSRSLSSFIFFVVRHISFNLVRRLLIIWAFRLLAWGLHIQPVCHVGSFNFGCFGIASVGGTAFAPPEPLPTCAPLVPHLCSTCAPLVPHLCPTCARPVPDSFPTCAPVMPRFCPTSAPLLPDLCETCAPLVPPLASCLTHLCPACDSLVPHLCPTSVPNLCVPFAPLATYMETCVFM